MGNQELPERNNDIEEKRLLWGGSFLVDWLIPMIEDNRIHTLDEIISLREVFQPLHEEPGTDFSLGDVLRAATRSKEYIEEQQLKDRYFRYEHAKALEQAIRLLGVAVGQPKLL